MTPLLFAANTTKFDTNGIGALADAVSCIVTEERNGMFELEMQYPITGLHYAEIALSSIIVAVPGDGRTRQPFRIYKITKPLNGIVTVYAQHISYQLSHIPCMPFSAGSAGLALAGFKTYAAEACPFEFWTDVTTAGNYSQVIPASIRSRLGGVEGSILDTYGGEYEWDGYTVKLHTARGADNGVTLRYGKNITDLTQEENISSTITGVCPYWAGTDGITVTLPEKVLSAENAANFPYPRTVPLDLSGEFEEKPTVEELRAKAQAYISKSGIGVPTVSLDVSFVALWQTEDYKDIAPLERVRLCDTVTVLFEKLGVSAKAKVISTVYNVLLDRYDHIEIGDAKSTLAGTIASTNQTVAEKTSTSFLQAAVDRATGWITGANGGYVVMCKDADGQPYEILIMDTPNIETAQKVWRWNSGGLGYSKNGYAGPYSLAMTQDGAIVADFITAGTINANLVKIINLIVDHLHSEVESGERTLDATATGVTFRAANNTKHRISMFISSADQGVIRIVSGDTNKDGTVIPDNGEMSIITSNYISLGKKSDGSYNGNISCGSVSAKNISLAGALFLGDKGYAPKWYPMNIGGQNYMVPAVPY
ncbi:phage tail spike protein [Pygmaiobacter massiliensis]|uniref:phage tail spike protein n=1 Tax=Pygmaiobacter massiliensis TaxID=1917873 RepID=UPI000C7C59F9|nr:phage tail spike protein [Pygmaiobacter massiliensis]